MVFYLREALDLRPASGVPNDEDIEEGASEGGVASSPSPIPTREEELGTGLKRLRPRYGKLQGVSEAIGSVECEADA